MMLNLKIDDKEKDWKISLLKEANNAEKWKFRSLLILLISSIIIVGFAFIAYRRNRISSRLILQLELSKEREKKKRLEIEQAIESETKGDYIKLKNLIKINHNAENDWQEIRGYFDQLSPNFFDALENRSDELSPADKKLAALIHLRIDNQDAANILHIARASVKTARYRLKRNWN